MQTSRSFLLLSLVIISPALLSQRTWRIDYYHTGGPGIEAFSLDRVVVEPLDFPGNPDGYVEQALTGNYRFEVRKSGKVVYSRGYSSIFAEWSATDEATNVNRTSHESLRFPAPSGIVNVVILKRGRQNAFAEVWRQAVDPADMFIQRATPPRPEVIPIETHGKPSVKADIVLLGDGYTASQSKKFVKDARRLLGFLFAKEPFKSRRKDFNSVQRMISSVRSGMC